jgi:hypothetical protein
MSTDCAGCDEAVQECAAVIAALVRRLGAEGVELTDEELGAFTPDLAVVFRRGETGVRVEISSTHEATAEKAAEGASCGS